MMELRFLPQAEAELLHEVGYYSTVRPGSGARFQGAVEAALGRATRHPNGGAPAPHETRTILVKGFPFSIVYRLSESEVLGEHSRSTCCVRNRTRLSEKMNERIPSRKVQIVRFGR